MDRPVWSRGRYVGNHLVDELNAIAIRENFGPIFEKIGETIYAARGKGAPLLVRILNEVYLHGKLPAGMKELCNYKSAKLETDMSIRLIQ